MVESTPAPEKRRRGRPKKAKAGKESKDFRLLEAVKLTKRFLPVTINGHPVAKIIEVQTKEGTDESKPKQVPKKVKQKIVADHIERVLKRDPTQPLYLSFVITPSDPDFPFELDVLKFNLTIPARYPHDAKATPSLIVLNSEIPRGFAVNIERGFRQIALLAKSAGKVTIEGPHELEELKLVDGKGLLSQVQTLDKYLEFFLKQEKKQTVKFITFKNAPKRSPLPTPEPTPPPPTTHVEQNLYLPKSLPENVTKELLERRAALMEQMCTRLGEYVKLFNKSASESRYKVKIPISKPQGLPYLWTYNNTSVDVFLSVPILYPLAAAKISVASNFSTNLLVAKKLALQEGGQSLVALVEEAKQAEKNLKANMAAWLDDNLLAELADTLNWLRNNLSEYVKDQAEHEQWLSSMETIRAFQPDTLSH